MDALNAALVAAIENEDVGTELTASSGLAPVPADRATPDAHRAQLEDADRAVAADHRGSGGDRRLGRTRTMGRRLRRPIRLFAGEGGRCRRSAWRSRTSWPGASSSCLARSSPLGSLTYDLGTPVRMGPGYVPLLLGPRAGWPGDPHHRQGVHCRHGRSDRRCRLARAWCSSPRRCCSSASPSAAWGSWRHCSGPRCSRRWHAHRRRPARRSSSPPA